MGTLRRGAARVAFSGIPHRIGLQSAPYPNDGSLNGTRLFAILALAVAVSVTSAPHDTWMIISRTICGAACFCLLVGTFFSPHAFTPGTVRVKIDSALPRLSFRGVAALVFDWSAFAFILLWAGAACVLMYLEVEEHGDAFTFGQLPRSMGVVLGLGVFSIGLLARRLRQEFRASCGLHLTPERIVAAGDGAFHQVEWKDLDRATIETRRIGGLHLVLLNKGKMELGAVSVRYLGSDPMVIAAFLYYFRDRPEERELLSDPERAIAQFEQHLAQLEAAECEQNAAEPSG